MNEKIIAIIGIGLCILFLVFGIFNTVKVNRVKRELQSVIESNQRINEELETARRIISELRNLNETTNLDYIELEKTIEDQTEIIRRLRIENSENRNRVRDIESIIRTGENIIDELIQWFQDHPD